MQAITFRELVAAISGEALGITSLDAPVTSIVTDSRDSCAGGVFWAIKGRRFDGHNFAAAALHKGAVAAVVERREVAPETAPVIVVENTLSALWAFSAWYRNLFDALLIGVTGSVGKSTTRHVIQSVLSAQFQGMESPANFNNQFGVPLSLLELDEHHEFAVIELAASHLGEIAPLARVARPEIGVVTAVCPTHLDEFGSMANIAATKSEILRELPPFGLAVLNGDDRNVRKMSQLAPCPVVLVGKQSHNDLIADEIAVQNAHLSFRVGATQFTLPAVGEHNVLAALIAIAIGRHVGMSDHLINLGLASFRPLPGRCELLRLDDCDIIDDSYNASPVAMSAACRTLRDWTTTGKRILVAGDMLALGEWTEDFHRLLGEEVVRNRIDCLILVGDQAEVVARGAINYGMTPGQIAVCSNHALAKTMLDLWLTAGDVVLVKGSRLMRMESLVDAMKKKAQQVPSPTRRAA